MKYDVLVKNYEFLIGFISVVKFRSLAMNIYRFFEK